MIGEAEHALVKLSVISHEHPAFARRDGFGAVKRKGPELTHAAGVFAEVFGTNRFGCVLDDRETSHFPDRQNALHLAEIPVKDARQGSPSSST